MQKKLKVVDPIQRNILVVIDMQNDFITGSLGTKEAEAIVPNVINKIIEYKNNNGFIIATQDTHQENYLETPEGKKLPVKHCIYQTSGWQLEKHVDEAIGDYPSIVIFKGTFGTNKLVEGIKRVARYMKEVNIELIGLCTDICVISNAILLKTALPEANIKVDASCCAGVTPELHRAAFDVMKSCQIDIIGE